MSSPNDTISRTLIVATLLCIVCSVFVSAAAVLLRERQEVNKAIDRNKNILSVAGLFDEEKDDPAAIPKIFAERIEVKIVELATGEFSDEFDLETFDQRDFAKDPDRSVAIPTAKDIAGIGRRSKYAIIYRVKENGAIGRVVLPMHGMGLWSRMWGFLAVDKNTTTIRGLTFYEQGETPGLGGEVENKRWKALWGGKEIFDAEWKIRIRVVKGVVDTSREEAKHQVDGLAGATITSVGVTDLLHYWLGEEGFGPFLERMRAQVN